MAVGGAVGAHGKQGGGRRDGSWQPGLQGLLNVLAPGGARGTEYGDVHIDLPVALLIDALAAATATVSV